MTFVESIQTCFSKYATFSGRASRSEYWWFCLFNFLVAFILVMLELSTLSTIYTLATFLPSLAACVRRLHDVGKSGWMYFVAFIPIVGAIWLLVLSCTDSQPGANEYGENPKGI